MFYIGEFSKMGKTTVKTLHHYDRIGLLRPAAVDGATGYRPVSYTHLHLDALAAPPRQLA